MSDENASGDDPAAFEERLDEIADALDESQTEADLDAIEADLEAVEHDVEKADLPEPPDPEDDDEEPEPDPREALEDRIDDLREGLEAQRGPYAKEVLAAIESGSSTIRDTEWADEGREALVDVVTPFLAAIEDVLDTEFDAPTEPDPAALADAIEVAADSVADAELHPDQDTPEIESLLGATATLEDGIGESTAFGDLPVREQLNRRGFFDVLGHYKDFPPEWSALKVHENERNVEMILLAFDLLDSNFMEDHCIDALRRLGDPAALEPMLALAQRRDKDAIAVLGSIGDPEPVEMILDYAGTESDPLLQLVSLRTLGEIGDTTATVEVAQQLRAEDDRVRSAAARSLGMIGDPRAVEPLAGVIEDDAVESVRGSAAWALVEIGTGEALDIVRDYSDDRSFLVEVEARKASA